MTDVRRSRVRALRSDPEQATLIELRAEVQALRQELKTMQASFMNLRRNVAETHKEVYEFVEELEVEVDMLAWKAAHRRDKTHAADDFEDAVVRKFSGNSSGTATYHSDESGITYLVTTPGPAADDAPEIKVYPARTAKARKRKRKPRGSDAYGDYIVDDVPYPDDVDF